LYIEKKLSRLDYLKIVVFKFKVLNYNLNTSVFSVFKYTYISYSYILITVYKYVILTYNITVKALLIFNNNNYMIKYTLFLCIWVVALKFLKQQILI